MSDINHNNAYSKLDLAEAERLLGPKGNKTVNVPITQVHNRFFSDYMEFGSEQNSIVSFLIHQ